jgi:hypothetical protein
MADAPSVIGGGGPAFAPGTFKVTLEKFEHKANRAQTSVEPQATLKIFEVVDCPMKPNAQQELAGTSYFASNRFKTSNEDINKANKQMVARLIKVCGKSEKWKKYLEAMASAEQVVTTGAMCAWINDNCKGTALLITLTPQYTKPGEAPACDKSGNPYLNHEYLGIGEEEKTPTREPVAQPATPTPAPTDNPFGA